MKRRTGSSSYGPAVSRRRLLRAGVFGSAAVAGWALLACGGDGERSTTASSTTAAGTPIVTGAQPTGAQPSAAAVQATPAGRRGGTMRVSKRAPDIGLDPAISSISHMHTALAYSHVLMYHLSANKYYLDLAQSLEQAEPTRMVFKLRPNVKFAPNVAGGRPLTSEDIAYSYRRFPDTLKNFASNINQLQWGWMNSFETPDSQTLVIKLAAPYASAIPLMGSSAFAVVSKELVEANGGKLTDVMNAGSGPYVMTKRDATSTRYERNPNYYRHAPAEGTYVEDGPYVDAWEEAIIADAAAGEARFLAGDLDMLHVNIPGAIDKLKADEIKNQKGVVIARATNHVNFGLIFDNEKWAQHPKLREAVSLAVDRDKWIRQIYLGEGLYTSPVSPIFDSALPQEELKQLQKFDPARAKQLWAEGGGSTVFPNGLRTLAPTFNEAWVTATDFTKRELEANLGVNVKVTPADAATFIAVANAREKEWEIFLAGDSSITTIPENNGLSFYVPAGFGSRFANLRLDSAIGENKTFAERADQLFSGQSRELDPQKRRGLLQDLQRLFIKEFRPVLPLPIGAWNYAAYRERVKNFPEKDFGHINASAGVFRAHNLSLAS